MLRPKPKSYPINTLTIGDHIRKRRLDLNLTQGCVAKLIGCTEPSLYGWEKNRCQPIIKFYPNIIKFLGYIPFKTETTTNGEKIRLYRKLNGMSLRKLAKLTGYDQGKILEWERGRGKPCEKFLEKINKYFILT